MAYDVVLLQEKRCIPITQWWMAWGEGGVGGKRDEHIDGGDSQVKACDVKARKLIFYVKADASQLSVSLGVYIFVGKRPRDSL